MRLNRLNFGELLLLTAILLLSVYLRLTNVVTNPGWYTDEGTDIDIAHHLQMGQIQYLAVNQSFLLFGRPPLFQGILALAFDVFGTGIGTLRALTGTLGVISVALLYWMIRRTGARVLALVAALMLAIYPNAMIYSRIGYSYNLLTPLILLAFWGLWEYLSHRGRRWLALAALAIGIGSLSNLMSFNFVLPLVIVTIYRRPRDLFWALPLLAAPFVLYVLIMLLTVPQAFLFDAQYTLFRLGKNDLAYQLTTLWLNFYAIISKDFWISIGIIGLFTIPASRLRNLSILMLLSPLFTLGRTLLISQLGYYYIIPLLPFFALGMASLVMCGVPRVFEMARGGITRLLAVLPLPKSMLIDWLKARFIAVGAVLMVFYLLVGPFVAILLLHVFSIQDGFSTPIQSFLLNPSDAQQVADYVNQTAQPDDVVITSPGLAWALNTRVADFQMAIAYNHVATEHLPDNIPADRWVYDVRYTQARYVIIDNLWINWAIDAIDEVRVMTEDVQAHWQLVFASGVIEVYENPARR